MDRTSRIFLRSGFTLVELLITLAILAVTATLAAPGMQSLIKGNRLRVETGRLLNAVNLARSEAILRNTVVSLCPSQMAESGLARCDGEFSNGWIVFVNPNSDSQVDEDSDEVIRAFEAIPRGLRLSNRAGDRPIEGLITFLPDGSARRNLTMMLCAVGERPLPSWSVVLNFVGRARLAKGLGLCA